jgi:pimeloyl-ACP methyl ester carboxylesterase
MAVPRERIATPMVFSHVASTVAALFGDEGPHQVAERVDSFTFDDDRLVYTTFGDGDRVVVLLHGQLMSRRMHAPLARQLASTGYRVVTLDLLGHGDSDRPAESWRYSMTNWGSQVVALLDHLGVDEAVVGGTSLGANVTLEVSVNAPERMLGALVEMPVLDNAVVAGLATFAPLLFTARFLPYAVRATAWAADLVPQGRQWVDVVTDALHQQPEAMAAMVHGLFFGRVAPPGTTRRQIRLPTLVIGHRRDPVHPFGDADMLATEIAGATFVEANSPVELRFRPERLTGAIGDFLAGAFAEIPATRTSGSRPRV